MQRARERRYIGRKRPAEEPQRQFLALLRRFRDRADDPSARPDGAMPVEYHVLSYPLLDLASLPVPPGGGT